MPLTSSVFQTSHSLCASITSSIGHVSLFTTDWTIERACGAANPHALPRDLQHILLILRFCQRIHRTMGANERSPTGHPVESESIILMKLLERDFEDLERQMGDALPRLSITNPRYRPCD